MMMAVAGGGLQWPAAAATRACIGRRRLAVAGGSVQWLGAAGGSKDPLLAWHTHKHALAGSLARLRVLMCTSTHARTDAHTQADKRTALEFAHGYFVPERIDASKLRPGVDIDELCLCLRGPVLHYAKARQASQPQTHSRVHARTCVHTHKYAYT